MADNPRIEDLRRRVQKDPASIAFAQLAEEYRRAGQHQESVDACRAGLALHPGYLSARVTLGRALIELGQLDDAETELGLVLKTAPENLAAIRGIADIQYKRGNLADALQFYQTALGMARNDPELEQLVDELTQKVKPSKRADPKDGLSLDDMHRELTARVTAPRPTVVPKSAAPQPVAPKAVPPPVVATPPPAPAAVDAPAVVQAPPVAAPPAAVAASVVPVPPAAAAPAAAAPVAASSTPASSIPSVTVVAPKPAFDPEATVIQKAPTFLRRPPQEDPARDRSLQTVAALEKLLDAINVTRSQRVP